MPEELPGLKRIQANVEALAEEQAAQGGAFKLSLQELLNDHFIQTHTKAHGLEDLFRGAGFDPGSEGGIEALESEQFAHHLARVSPFGNAQELIDAARQVWIEEKARQVFEGRIEV